jgi:hypothetical protein
VRRAAAVGALVVAFSCTALIGNRTDREVQPADDRVGQSSAAQTALDHAAQVLDPFRRAAEESSARPVDAAPAPLGHAAGQLP